MKIKEIKTNKKEFLSLLLLADEQEDMVDQYIEKGTMFVLEDTEIVAECVVTNENNGILEIKNIAVKPEYQGRGYGKALVNFIAEKYKEQYSILQVGTGDSPLTIPFYEKCGFNRSHVVRNFFTDNYDHPIYENGVQLIDMIYLKRML
ncbi:MAG: GNAT family N-acetyltransferase [Candidatus Gastranaerophilales bacterium]|nr:GNAT family N-acetyltransferase [Candidatus Gastranaerophilales bacterium]MCM1072730.1 GNAT family N-acetyltransferase [Bacteroides sp.]